MEYRRHLQLQLSVVFARFVTLYFAMFLKFVPIYTKKPDILRFWLFTRHLVPSTKLETIPSLPLKSTHLLCHRRQQSISRITAYNDPGSAGSRPKQTDDKTTIQFFHISALLKKAEISVLTYYNNLLLQIKKNLTWWDNASLSNIQFPFSSCRLPVFRRRFKTKFSVVNQASFL